MRIQDAYRVTCPACGRSCRGPGGLMRHLAVCPDAAAARAGTPTLPPPAPRPEKVAGAQRRGYTCRVCGGPCSTESGRCNACYRQTLNRRSEASYRQQQQRKRATPAAQPASDAALLAIGAALDDDERAVWRLEFLRRRAHEAGL